MKRRTGSIDKTTAGRFRVRVTLPDGRRPGLSTHDTREEAEQALAAAIAVMETGVTTGLTVKAWGERWLTDRELSGDIRDPESDWSRFRTHIASDPIARLGVKSVSRHDVKQWLARVRRKVARQTALNTLNILRGMLADAVERGYARGNPAAAIKVKRQKRTEEPWTYLTPEEQTRLIEQFAGRERFIVAFAIGSGLRAGELCSLRLRDVKPGKVIVRYGTPPNLSTKTGRIREVPLLGMAQSALDAWLSYPQDENPHGLVFPRARGGFRDPKHVIRWEQWQQAIKGAELGRELRWHDLRHTCASSLVSGWWGRAWSIEEVKEVLGHESITTTQRYAHLASRAIERAARETPQDGHALAMAAPAGGDGDMGKDGSAPAPTRTGGHRFRKPVPTDGVSGTYLTQGRTLAESLLVSAAKGESARALTLGVELAEFVLGLCAARGIEVSA